MYIKLFLGFFAVIFSDCDAIRKNADAFTYSFAIFTDVIVEIYYN